MKKRLLETVPAINPVDDEAISLRPGASRLVVMFNPSMAVRFHCGIEPSTDIDFIQHQPTRVCSWANMVYVISEQHNNVSQNKTQLNNPINSFNWWPAFQHTCFVWGKRRRRTNKKHKTPHRTPLFFYKQSLLLSLQNLRQAPASVIFHPNWRERKRIKQACRFNLIVHFINCNWLNETNAHSGKKGLQQHSSSSCSFAITNNALQA